MPRRDPNERLTAYRRARRAGLGAVLLLALAAAVVARTGWAENVVVPPDLQAELVAKLAGHDRSFAARAGAVARVFVLVKKGDARSRVSSSAILVALSRLERIGGVPHEDKIVEFETTEALVLKIQAEHAAIVYVTQGFESHVEELRAALDGSDVLTVSAVPEYVPRGIVLGFDLVSGKPRILLNFEQAKAQNVRFQADVVALMKVYR